MGELKWFKVCSVQELRPGQARSIRLLARPYAVFNVDGALYGLEAACHHAKANLASGKLDGEIVTCFMHGWQYNVRTGACLTEPQEQLTMYPVKTEDNLIYIGLNWPPQPSNP